ncbi:hypothetical protein MPTK1_3g18550 [Marchantia polymorpha subsp. ruderalis]|uniref:Uncharacterized protein n=2 Tax=Marchantia polymorpha TaxID=3197 RepID=A0AAF6B285_MARPO|nr:hypothetical protein MARPO_0142s0038 [Marchantia polymorpha]BBN06119.1 hypothetical protein Mp_3g18550 [Marchantia polymorpha subsp. ruderalis]|eukprot:PTQ29411.1 hypothetical protein MARPO_0142s0038 [Marchantia polymorpha]
MKSWWRQNCDSIDSLKNVCDSTDSLNCGNRLPNEAIEINGIGALMARSGGVLCPQPPPVLHPNAHMACPCASPKTCLGMRRDG